MLYSDPSGHFIALVGALVGAVVGAGAAKTVGGTVTKTVVKEIVKKAAVVGTTEAIGGFAMDVGRQVIVDEKSFDEVDYGQAVKTGAIAGLAGAGGYAVSAAATATK